MYNLTDLNERELFAIGAAIGGGYDEIAQIDFMRVFDDCFNKVSHIKSIRTLLLDGYKQLIECDLLSKASTFLEIGFNYEYLPDSVQILHDSVVSECIRHYDEMPRELKTQIDILNNSLERG